MKRLFWLPLMLVTFLAMPALSAPNTLIKILSGPASGTLTGAGSTASVAVDIPEAARADRAAFSLHMASIAGGTCDIKVRGSYDGGSNYLDIPTVAWTDLSSTSTGSIISVDGPLPPKLQYLFTGSSGVTAATVRLRVNLAY